MGYLTGCTTPSCPRTSANRRNTTSRITTRTSSSGLASPVRLVSYPSFAPYAVLRFISHIWPYRQGLGLRLQHRHPSLRIKSEEAHEVVPASSYPPMTRLIRRSVLFFCSDDRSDDLVILISLEFLCIPARSISACISNRWSCCFQVQPLI